jgi:hypothetical protein
MWQSPSVVVPRGDDRRGATDVTGSGRTWLSSSGRVRDPPVDHPQILLVDAAEATKRRLFVADHEQVAGDRHGARGRSSPAVEARQDPFRQPVMVAQGHISSPSSGTRASSWSPCCASTSSRPSRAPGASPPCAHRCHGPVPGERARGGPDLVARQRHATQARADGAHVPASDEAVIESALGPHA